MFLRFDHLLVDIYLILLIIIIFGGVDVYLIMLLHIFKLVIALILFFLQNDPVIPAFPDLHLSPAAILKELSSYFQNFSSQTRLLTLQAPHEIQGRELQEYPFC
jgi:hypothetical protein